MVAKPKHDDNGDKALFPKAITTQQSDNGNDGGKGNKSQDQNWKEKLQDLIATILYMGMNIKWDKVEDILVTISDSQRDYRLSGLRNAK